MAFNVIKRKICRICDDIQRKLNKDDNLNIEEKVKHIIAAQLEIPVSAVTLNSSFIEDLGADSLDVIELIMAFEEAFHIDVPDIDTEKVLNVRDAIAYIIKKGQNATKNF